LRRVWGLEWPIDASHQCGWLSAADVCCVRSLEWWFVGGTITCSEHCSGLEIETSGRRILLSPFVAPLLTLSVFALPTMAFVHQSNHSQNIAPNHCNNHADFNTNSYPNPTPPIDIHLKMPPQQPTHSPPTTTLSNNSQTSHPILARQINHPHNPPLDPLHRPPLPLLSPNLPHPRLLHRRLRIGNLSPKQLYRLFKPPRRSIPTRRRRSRITEHRQGREGIQTVRSTIARV
jgi:hypothetical protein